MVSISFDFRAASAPSPASPDGADAGDDLRPSRPRPLGRDGRTGCPDATSRRLSAAALKDCTGAVAPPGDKIPKGLLALLVAGALLQRQGRQIQLQPTERYPHAVLRVIRAMPEAARKDLRSAVTFLLGTDLRWGPFSNLAKYHYQAKPLLIDAPQPEPATAGVAVCGAAADRRR